MSEQTALAQRKESGMTRVRNYMMSPEVKERFTEMMGPNGIYYLNQVLITVANSEDLQKCTPQSVLISAMRAASLKLSVDPAKGQAWIIPYTNHRKGDILEAQFQLGYKGVYELAMRTGKYRFINVPAIYEGEIVTENRMTGIHVISGQRTSERVIGWLLYFQLVTGFEKTYYMTVEEIAAHAKHYASVNFNNPKSKWNDKRERPKMEKKTVLSNGLKMWGVFNEDDKAIMDRVENETVATLPSEEEITVIPEEKQSEDQLMHDLGFDPEPKAKTVTSDDYHNFVKKLGWDARAAQEVLKKAGGDFEKALELAKATVPAEKN